MAQAFPAILRLQTWAKLQFGSVQPLGPLKLRQITLPSGVKLAKALRWLVLEADGSVVAVGGLGL